MKRVLIGRTYYANDYKENVTVIAITRAASKSFPEYSIATIRRANGSTTMNYPTYLLSRISKSVPR